MSRTTRRMAGGARSRSAWWTGLARWGRALRGGRLDAGMTTAEYAVGTLAACAFAAVLLAIVRSGAVKAALTAVITSALSVAG